MCVRVSVGLGFWTTVLMLLVLRTCVWCSHWQYWWMKRWVTHQTANNYKYVGKKSAIFSEEPMLHPIQFDILKSNALKINAVSLSESCLWKLNCPQVLSFNMTKSHCSAGIYWYTCVRFGSKQPQSGLDWSHLVLSGLGSPFTYIIIASLQWADLHVAIN